MTTIPLVDLHAQYLSMKDEIDAAIAEVIGASAFIRSPHVDRFEAEFAAAIGARLCVSCANGTDALYIAMSALGLRSGEEVIVPAMSWISTSETVTQAGGRVVFCEIDPETHTLDPERLADVITSRTVGIIPVHLYGHPARMDRIMEIASTHGLWVLEDCAQAHLAEFRGRKVGTFGVAGTFSFYPGKNLGAMGDAGGIVTNDAALAERMAMFARHGGLKKHDHQIEGINSRLDGLQAAILNVKLAHLPSWTERRHSLAERYGQSLAGSAGITLPVGSEWAKHVWHVYQIRVADRDELMQRLKAQGIQTGVNYPNALPFLPCYAHHGHGPDDFPIAYALGKQTLSLPIYPEMTEAQQAAVVESLRQSLPKV
ncbi:DegT/DnrJ/EryC1/StrS family aminotransferase [Roseovarius sp.]|uniref:DegT/DnrJ/EryC1/StrS family aminotransferase n=1 Tax=Roseovarius sp. TaxID=1486281 RepID=UPI003BAA5A04